MKREKFFFIFLVGALGMLCFSCLGGKTRTTEMRVIILKKESDSMVVQVNESVPFTHRSVSRTIDGVLTGGVRAVRFALGKSSSFNVGFTVGDVSRKTSTTLFWLENHSNHEVKVLMFPFGWYKGIEIEEEDYEHYGLSHGTLETAFRQDSLYYQMSDLLKKLEGTPYVQTFAPGEHKAYILDEFNPIKGSREQ